MNGALVEQAGGLQGSSVYDYRVSMCWLGMAILYHRLVVREQGRGGRGGKSAALWVLLTVGVVCCVALTWGLARVPVVTCVCVCVICLYSCWPLAACTLTVQQGHLVGLYLCLCAPC